MQYNNNRIFRIENNYLSSILCALIVTAIFSIRWHNCLPFSGYMPLANNTDQLDIFARFLIWAKEPFSFPLGEINGFTFPFKSASITRGPLPLFALIFKALSRIYQPFSEFNYFVFAELVLVFIAAFFACRILDSYRIKSVWLKLLGAVLVGLSFPLLHRSSNFYGLTMVVVYVPLYTAFAYFFIRIHKYPNIKSLLLMAFFLSLTAFFDYYILFGVFFMSSMNLIFQFINFFIVPNRVNRRRFFCYLSSFVLGIALVFCVISFLGKQGDLNVPSNTTMLHRNEVTWGYGGGFGGGFHVADVLTLIIPPQDDIEGVPEYKRCGPSAYLTKMGFPLTTIKLQSGQYEGFAYLGTTTILIIVFISIIGFVSFVRKRRSYLFKFKMNLSNKLHKFNDIFSLEFIIGISTFALFVFSLGYIIHIGGVRFNNVGTPTLFLAELWNKFQLARSLGRLAIPFMLYFTFIGLVLFSKIALSAMQDMNKIFKTMAIIGILLLSVFHAYEIRGYLRESKVISGNEIADVFNKHDAIEISEILKEKKGVIFAYPIRDDDIWLKTCYSIGFHSGIPISGIYSGISVNPNHRKQTDTNRNNVRSGHIRELAELYGDVAFAAPCKIAKEILQISDMPLLYYEFESNNITLLTLKN